jgi:negative regulator of sigma E activity
MDCREAQAVLSALADRETIPAEELASAREHCTGCSECATFEAAIERIRRAAPPEAPADLFGRIIAALEAEAVEARARAEEEAAVVATPDTPRSEPTAPAVFGPTLTRPRLWAATGAITMVAATVMLGVLINAQVAQKADVTQEVQGILARSIGAGAQSAAPAPSAGTATDAQSAPAAPPPSVAFGGRVYRPATTAPPVNASVLTTVGVVRTALDATGDPVDLTALRSNQDPGGIVLRSTDGTYRVFAPVTRMLGGVAYQLATGVDLPRYGVWPRLPTEIPEPTSPDGAPVFVAAGADDSGAVIFVRAGFDAQNGFAVAPGTGASDPAGGNPYWTWWARVP